MLNKRGQVGETVTWIVATLIIIVLLLISIYASTLLAKTKIIRYGEETRTQDIVMENSLFAYFWLADKSIKKQVYDNLLEMNNEGKFPYQDFDESFEKLKGELKG